MKRLSIILVVALALTGCGSHSESSGTSEVLKVEFTAINATNALRRVEQLVHTCTPRDAGTPGAEAAALWIQRQLSEAGVNAKLERFSDTTPRGEKEFRNVLAEIPGSGESWIILLSHFDTMSGIGIGFEGANDSGSSTGLLLELAALLQQTVHARHHNILCGFMDGEECMITYRKGDGFHGSKHLAAQIKREKRPVAAVICLDMIGDRDLKISVPRNGSAALRVLALEAATAVGARDKIGLYDYNIYDDHQAFLDIGFPAVNLIDFNFGSAPGLNDYWHTPQDTLDKLSVESLLTTGQIVLEMLRRL